MDFGKYSRIRLGSIPPFVPVPFDLYIKVGDRFVHYLRIGDQITSEKKQQLIKKAADHFYILSVEFPRFKEFINSLILGDELETSEKASVLRESSMALVEELFESPHLEKALTQSKEVVNQFLDLMRQDAEAMGHLIGLSGHDFYTYNHSVDVSVYSLGLGQILGYSGEDLKTIGLGGLFHDIGKRNIPISIITKQGPLDDSEWEQMRKHPEYGLAILMEQKIDSRIKACCFEHHEGFFGGGYPREIQGEEIHKMARIVSVADTYDALTTKRSYQDPMTPKVAIEFMRDRLKQKFDPDVMKAMLEVLRRMEESQAS
ncbi:MAG: HD domain-containing protein [Bdellovibrionales bacterium]|nr:HD domain-containing protein [Bdellovibrionales bacterium]